MKMPILMRVSHYYASMLCCFLFAFYACSGFIATHADWFIGDSHQEWQTISVDLPAACVEDVAKQHVFCKLQLIGAESVITLENDDYEQWYLVRAADSALLCVLSEEKKSVELKKLYPCPSDTHTHEELALAIAAIHGGEVAQLRHDEDYNRLSFDLESVWFKAELRIYKEQGVYEIKEKSAHFIRAISDLHRGKHANGFQVFLADLTAILLTFVIVSGAIIGIQMKKRRKLGIFGLAFSLLLTILLIVFR